MTQKNPLCNYSGLIKELQTGDTTPGDTTTSIGTLIGGATVKSTPVDADKIAIRNSVSGLLESLSIADLKTLLNTIYAVVAGKSGGQTLIGGSAVTDILKLQGTSGNGTATSPAIQALVGNNGATVAYTVLNNGNVGIGTTSPTAQLTLVEADSSALTDFLINPTAKTSGNLMDLQVNGASKFSVSKTGSVSIGGVADGTANEPLSIWYNGTKYMHMIMSDSVKGIGISDTYFAIYDTGLANPQMGMSTTNGSSLIRAYSATNSATKQNLYLESSGELWLYPTNGDAVRVPAASLEPYADNVAANTLGTASKRWSSANIITIAAGTLTTTGNVGIGTTGPTAAVDVNSDILRLRTAKTPASSSDTGNQGDSCWDSNYEYRCTATNTWKSIPPMPFHQTLLDCGNSVLADGSMRASSVNISVDESLNLLKFKVVYANGTTIKTGSLALS